MSEMLEMLMGTRRPPLVLDMEDRQEPGRLVNALAEHGVTCTWEQARGALDLLQHGQREPQKVGAVVRDSEGTFFTRVQLGGPCPWVAADEYVGLEEGETAGVPWSRISRPTILSPGIEVNDG